MTETCWFTDNTGDIVMIFPTGNEPALNLNIEVSGKFETGDSWNQMKVNTWQQAG